MICVLYILCKINANDELEMHFFDDMSLSVCKLLTFSSSFPQPTGRFRIKLSKTSFGELKELKIACWNDVGLKGEIIMKKNEIRFFVVCPICHLVSFEPQKCIQLQTIAKNINFFLKDVAMGEILILYGEMHNSDKTLQWLYIK